MSKFEAKRYGRKKIFKGYCFQVVVDDVLWPNQKRMKRDLLVHPGISVIVPELDKNHIILIRLYRYGAGQSLWEIPAGTINNGENPLACAKREIQEEIGYRAKNWKPIIPFFASPGFNTEIIHSYVARGLEKTQTALENDEIIESHIFSIAKVTEMVKKKKIQDAKSLVPLFYYLAERRLL